MRIALASIVVLCIVCSCGIPEQEREHDADSTTAAVRGPLKRAPLFTATNQDGAQWTSASLNGRIWIGSFMFTTCGSICPALNTVKVALQRDYADKGVRFLSITTDPDNDKPTVLKSYAQGLGARTDVWTFLTLGSTDSTKALSVDGFMLMAPDETHHSTRLVLVDANGMIRDYFDSSDSSEVQRLRTTLDALLSGKGT